MKSKFMQIVNKVPNVLPALALVFAVQSASAACFYFLHQPDVPEELQDL